MIRLFIIEDDEKILVEESSTLKISEQFVSFINRLFYNDIEVIFFKSGTLGSVMLNDGRFIDGNIQLDLDRLNAEVGGKAIRAGSNLLLPEHRGINICFVCYNINLTNGIATLFHELCHFYDIFTANIPYSRETENGLYIEMDPFIQNLIQIMLNDFYAEYRSFSIVIDLKTENIIKKLNMIYLIDRYIRLLNECYDNINNKLNEIEFVNHFNFELEMVKYSVDYFFKYFIGYLGMWNAFKDSSYSNYLLNTKWNDAVGLVRAFNNDVTANFLNQIKDIVLSTQDLNLFDENERIFTSCKELIMIYYHTDFLRLIY